MQTETVIYIICAFTFGLNVGTCLPSVKEWLRNPTPGCVRRQPGMTSLL